MIEVSVTRRFRLDPAAAAVTHHVTPLDAVDVTNVAGIACTTRNRTLCDLGAVCERQMVRRALTSARRSGIDLGPSARRPNASTGQDSRAQA